MNRFLAVTKAQPGWNAGGRDGGPGKPFVRVREARRARTEATRVPRRAVAMEAAPRARLQPWRST